MQRVIAGAALSALLVVAGCSGSSPGQVAEDLRETLAAYQTALMERNGRAAVELVNAETTAYYQRIREQALYAPPEHVRRLSLPDRIQVLLVRSAIDTARLKEMDGEDLFRYYVNEGWSGGGAGLRRVQLADFQIRGDVATAAQMEGDKPSPLRWRFEREAHRWRIDLTALLPLADRAMRHALAQTPLTEDQFVLKAIEQRSLGPVDEAIWQPLSPRLN